MGGTNQSKLEKDFNSLGVDLPEQFMGFENVRIIQKNNICYANSVLQVLYFCQEFRAKILEEGIYGHPDTLLGHLYQLFLQMSSSKKKTGIINTRKLMNKVRELNGKLSSELFNNDEHHDSHEFLIWLLDKLNEEVQKKFSVAGLKQKTWLENLFEGSFVSQTKCLCCETVTQRDEVFMDLSLDVLQNSSLLSSLRNYSKMETLTGPDKFLCEYCACKQEARKGVVIKKLPDILICHLKRFKYSETLRRYQKLCYRVAFPSELRLTNTVDECPDKLYELFAIIIHVGAGIQFGHYVAIVKSHGHWIKFDDDYVELADESLIQMIFGTSKEASSAPCGYLLFYRAVSS